MNPIKTGTPIQLRKLGQVDVQVVKILDETVSEVTSFSAFRTDKLEEWWLTPKKVFAWSESNIALCGCRDLDQLANMLMIDEDYRRRLMDIQFRICAETLPARSTSDFYWAITARHVDGIGPVISIVYGERKAFDAFLNERKPVRA